MGFLSFCFPKKKPLIKGDLKSRERTYFTFVNALPFTFSLEGSLSKTSLLPSLDKVNSMLTALFE